MATITVRNLDDEIKELLRISAAKNGHSMEEEARMILKQALVKSRRAMDWVPGCISTSPNSAALNWRSHRVTPCHHASSPLMMKMTTHDHSRHQRHFRNAAPQPVLQRH